MGTLVITNTLAALAAGNQPLSKIDQNFADIVAFLNGGNLDVVNVPSLAGKEPVLGVPASNGYLLSSSTGGVRSWIPPLAGQNLNMQTLTGNGTWTKPSGVSKVLIMLWGGGGGGGGGGGTGTKLGCGGGGGAFGFGVYTVNGNVSVTIGSGGPGGSGTNSGGSGNTSQVSGGGLPATLTCGGGGGGGHYTGIGGLGGTPGAGWLFSAVGGRGSGVSATPGGVSACASGMGGASPMGGPGGASVHVDHVSSGDAGVTPGGGGGGAPDDASGGAGAGGRAVFIWLA